MRVHDWQALNPADPFAFERKRRQRQREASLRASPRFQALAPGTEKPPEAA